MNKAELAEYYGSMTNAGKAIGRSKGSVSVWTDPPRFEIQCTFEILTGGKLKADRTHPRFQVFNLAREEQLRRQRQRELVPNAVEYERRAVDARMFKDALKIN